MSAQLSLRFTSYNRPANFLPRERRRLSKADVVSRTSLLLFRLIERLSKKGPGHVLKMPNLVAMFDKPNGKGQYSERTTWSAWNELLKLGWIDSRVYRKKGQSHLEFWPLVRVAEPKERIFLRRKTAPSIAPSTPKNCTLAPHSLDSSELSEAKEDDGKAVVVSCPDGHSELLHEAMELCDEQDAAQALATAERELKKKGKVLTPGVVRQAVKAAKDWVSRNAHIRPGAALTSALKGGWNPPAPVPVHASDKPRGAEEVKVFTMAHDPAAKAIREAAVAGSDAWEALDEFQRAELLEAAHKDVLENGSGAHKEQARKRGTGAMVVILRAKQLARGEG